MRKIVMIACLLALSACATPVTTLKNTKGETVSCGGGRTGSIIGGAIGASIEQSHDKKCVEAYKTQGYKVQ